MSSAFSIATRLLCSLFRFAALARFAATCFILAVYVSERLTADFLSLTSLTSSMYAFGCMNRAGNHMRERRIHLAKEHRPNRLVIGRSCGSWAS
jgi:hypothetical protein